MSVRRSSLFRAILSVALFALLAAPTLLAQVTSGNIAGTVSSPTDKSVLPGVTVEAVHVPTGTRYDTVSGANGRYVIPNVRPGGPYRITGTLEGFKTATVNVPEAKLGITTEVPLSMSLAAVTEAITVTAAAYDVMNPNRTGSTSQVTQEQIQTLPTVNRSLQDYARTNPYFVVDPADPTGTLMNVAGRNNRYNSILIDGAVNNDLFGLAASGTPGGQASTQPIALDALEQLQMVVSPYDVRQGGFTGGGVNVVTRSGTNDFHGSIFYAPRTEALVGKGLSGTRVSNFDQKQYGGRIGGPIVRDKLFFFGSGEINRRKEPTGISADSSATQTNVSAQAAQVRDFLIATYKYDPGPLSDFPKKTDSDLGFLRFDWNANNSNNLTLRHNYVKGGTDVVANRSSSAFRFQTATYNQADKTNSTVGQLNSVFGANAFNEARVTYQTIRDLRATPVTFPSIEIGGAEQSPLIAVGTERFSGANTLDQDVTELTDDFTWVKGNHSLTFGTHNEFFEFKNLFLSDAFGYYHFSGASNTDVAGAVANFIANKPDIYRISFANGSDPLAPTAFKVRQYGVYVSDTWHASNNLSLTFGLRGDLPEFAKPPSFNPLSVSALGFSTAQTPKQDWTLSPRIGFNWSIPGATRQQLRGGVGVFAGRAPYVWISNAYANTGVEASSLGCVASAGCNPPIFNADLAAQPRTGTGAVPSVDLIDSDFDFPRVIRTTLGYDRDLFFGIAASAEVLYSQTQKDVFYYNVNKNRIGTNPFDGRPTYRSSTSQILDAILLSNTSKGHELTETVTLSRPFASGVTLSANYAHQNAQSAFDATSSRAISNWRFMPTRGDIFKQEVARTQFEQEHRFNIAASYDFKTGRFGHSVGLFYNAESGRPFSLLAGGDPNTDGQTGDDLLYIPNAVNNVVICPSGTLRNVSAALPCGTTGTAATTPALNPVDSSLFNNYLSALGADPTKGGIVKRNSASEPWSRELDFHYALDLPVKFAGVQLTADVLNLLNMFDKNAGVVRFVSNQTTTVATYNAAASTSAGRLVYQEPTSQFSGGQRTESVTNTATGTTNFSTFSNPNGPYTTAFLRSRWQARWGVRLSF